MYVISQSLANVQSIPFAYAVKHAAKFVMQLYYVFTDHCIECGKTMDEPASYGIRCMRCEDGVMR